MLVIQVSNRAPLSSSTCECARSWHASVIALGAPDSVLVVTTAANGGLVPACSINGTYRAHPGNLARGMLSGAACSLLLLLGRLAVALTIDVILSLTLPTLVAIPFCFLTCTPQTKHSFLTY